MSCTGRHMKNRSFGPNYVVIRFSYNFVYRHSFRFILAIVVVSASLTLDVDDTTAYEDLMQIEGRAGQLPRFLGPADQPDQKCMKFKKRIKLEATLTVR